MLPKLKSFGLKRTVPVAAAVIAISAVASLPARAQQPPWEGCRPASKIEYDSAKANYLLRTRTRIYLQTGPFWRRSYWLCNL